MARKAGAAASGESVPGQPECVLVGLAWARGLLARPGQARPATVGRLGSAPGSCSSESELPENCDGL